MMGAATVNEVYDADVERQFDEPQKLLIASYLSQPEELTVTLRLLAVMKRVILWQKLGSRAALKN